MSRFTFDRWDFLGTRILLGLVAVVTPVVTLGVPVIDRLRDEPLRRLLPTTGSGAAPAGYTPQDGVTLGGAEGLEVSVPRPDTGTWLATLLPGLVVSVAVVLVAWLLLRLLGRIQDGRPFVETSVTSLRLIGATMVIGTLLAGLATSLADSVVGASALTAGQRPGLSFEIPVVTLVAALVVVALGEAFARGVRLQRDVEGLV